MDKIYYGTYSCKRDGLTWQVKELDIIAETEDFLIIDNGRNQFLLHRGELDTMSSYYTTYIGALASLRKQAQVNVDGAKEAQEKYQEMIDEINQQI